MGLGQFADLTGGFAKERGFFREGVDTQMQTMLMVNPKACIF